MHTTFLFLITCGQADLRGAAAGGGGGIILIGFQSFGSFLEVLHNLEAQDKLCKSSIKFLTGLFSMRMSCPRPRTVTPLPERERASLSGAFKRISVLATCSVLCVFSPVS